MCITQSNRTTLVCKILIKTNSQTFTIYYQMHNKLDIACVCCLHTKCTINGKLENLFYIVPTETRTNLKIIAIIIIIHKILMRVFVNANVLEEVTIYHSVFELRENTHKHTKNFQMNEYYFRIDLHSFWDFC